MIAGLIQPMPEFTCFLLLSNLCTFSLKSRIVSEQKQTTLTIHNFNYNSHCSANELHFTLLHRELAPSPAKVSDSAGPSAKVSASAPSAVTQTQTLINADKYRKLLARHSTLSRTIFAQHSMAQGAQPTTYHGTA